ncbi:MAG: PIN domain-containing protein [Deltaproteobacteria bacterium]|nr:PIN domain-containing protein [Deltaproteobacteria bacterium]
MTTSVLLDTGPLVAILSRKDSSHRVCVEQLRTIAPPLLTCWPVITEAAWLLRQYPLAVQRLLSSFSQQWIKFLPLAENDVEPIGKILQRYRKLNAQLADTALVHLAEREGIDTVFTLDRRDFSVYRFSGNRSFHLLPE